jgi:branched-chain amino acid transport system ATP-binding protein
MLAEGTYAEVSNNPQVMEAYMGTEAAVLEGAH